jgi:hypothetical protein
MLTLRLSTALAAVSFVAGLGFTEAQAAVNVFVGYADSLRPSGFFPNPWLGASGVVSQSSTAQKFDSGAIRIDNTGGTSVTISDFSVTLNGAATPTFTIWNSLVIPAGEIGIFTQTAQYNFDSSDLGGGVVGGILPPNPAANGIGGCSSSGLGAADAAFCASVEPVVSFKVDGGALQSFDDTGHILDTGHYDFISGSLDGNESIDWNPIGAAASRAGTGSVPEPSTWAMMLAGFGLLGLAAMRKGKREARRLAV